MRPSRREFIGLGAAAGVGALTAGVAAAEAPAVELIRSPDRASAWTDAGVVALKHGAGGWAAGDVAVTTDVRDASGAPELTVTVTAERTALVRLHLRWNGAMPGGWRYLGDAWERAYGDLEWRCLDGERVMPWYFFASDGRRVRGYGVKTGAGALCFWQADPEGVSLWLDLRNGASATRLNGRRLDAATVIAAQTPPHAFCKRLCDRPRLARAPIYGSNNWYYLYGQNISAREAVRDAALVAELSPSYDRPFMVIDGGWNGTGPAGGGPLDRIDAHFGDMSDVAAGIRDAGARPGIWMRPLLTSDPSAKTFAFRADRFGASAQGDAFVVDPSLPEALAYVEGQMRELTAWGYELIKHDFSTYDILGRWGSQMGADVTGGAWSFADRSRTTAEIVRELYAAIRRGAGEAVILGCNTICHLGAGVFEAQRIGDDTSGKDWNRTRTMGVNALGFRIAQQGAFGVVDPDCVAVTRDVPWDMTRQWLDLVSRSGTALFVSPDPAVLGHAQRRALRTALTRTAELQRTAADVRNSARAPAAALDWMEMTTPERWRFADGEARYRWFGSDGASPYYS